MNLLKKYGPALAVTLALGIAIWLAAGAISASVSRRWVGGIHVDQVDALVHGVVEQFHCLVKFHFHKAFAAKSDLAYPKPCFSKCTVFHKG